MGTRNIIVIGASAGGFDALKKLVKDLPPDLRASIFVVWHMSPDVTGVLPQVLNRAGPLPAKNAEDSEKIEPSRIYVAPPDRHLIIEDSHVRVTRGPKENRFRPAVDPLFRSAAYSHGARVIGVILSGALDDGTSGLWTIKHYGGLAVVQDPQDAEIPSMPQNALREVEVDHVVPVARMADLLVRLSQEEPAETSEVVMEDDKQTEFEIRAAIEDKTTGDILKFGELSPFTCPDCHGVLFRLTDGERPRFRCHTGHAFSADSLLTTVTESIEDSLWSAIRCIEESVMLLNHIGNHFAAGGQANLAAVYFKKALEAEARGEVVRGTVMNHERLSSDSLHEQVGDESGSEKISNTRAVAD
ncbi:MAG TPA: chemotaxis protein CheB [Pyrinomonadaceae bacterium]|jgi:two-component system chemotaxis response regulator CheB